MQTKDLLQIGRMVISVLVLALFGFAFWLITSKQLPPNAEMILHDMFTAVSSLATFVVGYWFGGSVGSDRKDDAFMQHITNSINDKNPNN